MADRLKINVDGKELEVSPGTLLIDACRASGIEVPSFCYYPGLSLQAACRMCLVEIEKSPKLQTACTVPVAPGMIVRTHTPQVTDARRSMLEFLLANHPLDCPVCDKGGECELQDMVFRYGAAESRFAEEKRHMEEQQWSPVVYFDAPRCILCYRCVRVCAEGMGVGALSVVNRGAQSEIAPNHGDHLECEECGMCIDICPVGALTSGAYRYKARPWEITYASTICTHCGDGCKTTLSVRNNKILRGNNRDRSGINGEFLCIKGRYAYDFVEHPERLRRPLIRKGDQWTEVNWDEAIRTVATRWKEILNRRKESSSDRREAFGVVGSNHTTNEESYLLQKFARTVLRTNHVDHHRTADFPALIHALRASPRAGNRIEAPLARSQDLANASAILLIGGNPAAQHPLIAWNIRQACRLGGSRLYMIHSQQISLLQQSYRSLPVIAGHETDAIRFLCGETGVEQKLLGRTPGGRDVTMDLLTGFRKRWAEESNVILVFGAEITGEAVSLVVQLGNQIAHARYILLADYSNSRGAADMGLLPHLLPGYLSLKDPDARSRFEQGWGSSVPLEPGWSVEEMVSAVGERRLETLYVVGANPLKGMHPVEFRSKTFLVVQDLFLHETAQAADVVLPGASAYEKSGTVTNTCGELQRLRKATDMVGTGTDLDILQPLAAAMEETLHPSRPEEVLQEICRLVPGYDVSLATVLAGGAAAVAPLDSFHSFPAIAGGGFWSAHDTLFTSGTLGRYSRLLSLVPENNPRNQPGPA